MWPRFLPKTLPPFESRARILSKAFRSLLRWPSPSRPRPSLPQVSLGALAAATALLLASCSDKENPAHTPESAPVEPAPPLPEPAEESVEIRNTAKAVILLYQRFSSAPQRASNTVMPAAEFRRQMEHLYNESIPVVPLAAYARWRNEKENIPPGAVILTFEDGYRDVYEHAFPILKEFNYPFTVFVYSSFVDGGGRSLSRAQLEEMGRAGMELGSGGFRHRRFDQLDSDAAEESLREELEGSRRDLTGRFGRDVPYFAYPYGLFTNRAAKMGLEAGYTLMLTQSGQAADWNTPLSRVPRFILPGNSPSTFDRIIEHVTPSTRQLQGHNLAVRPRRTAPHGLPLIPVQPASGAVIADTRFPTIEADLSALSGLDPDSLHMTVSGRGSVAASYDPDTGKVRHTLQHRLYPGPCAVQLTFVHSAPSRRRDHLMWTFQFDPRPEYLAGLKALGVSPQDAESTASSPGEP
ncbi:MAG TPA: polysaccharide deacetylase family protein [Verrucomicrobiales bacterium]|nr:polysaccharide deacetylase family protein [Verrucomicrobiales bacterium]